MFLSLFVLKTESNMGLFFFNKGTIPNKKSQQVFLECHGSFEHGGKGVPRGQVGYVVSYLRVENYIDFNTKMNLFVFCELISIA